MADAMKGMAINMDEELMSTKDKKALKKKLAAEKRAKKKAEKDAKKREEEGGEAESIFEVSASEDPQALTEEQERVAAARAVTGTLSSKPVESDLKFDSFSVMVGGNLLIKDCHLELNADCRYGLIGQNGSGKSNVLSALAQRDLPVPDHIDMFHLHEEAPANELTGVEAVIGHVVAEGERLEAMSQQILEDEGPDDERLEAIFNRIDELDTTGAEPKARHILFGLGFADHLVPMDRKTKHMSGGWRMRVSLAKALFAAPSLLLLDEPTNHLDLEACVWLEEHLSRYKKCLLVVSHSQDFLNSVCTDTIWLHNNTLKYYGGNYDTFTRVVDEEERVQMKLYKKQQADIEKLATYVRVNKANGVAASAKSKQKVMDKVKDEAVTMPRSRGGTLVFKFPDSERLPPPVLPFDRVAFSYSGKSEDFLYENLDLSVDYDSRVALVGPNGCGKSTLVKLMSGALNPVKGEIKKHPALRLAQYHQHSADVLDNDASPLEFMKRMNPDSQMFPQKEYHMKEEMWRSFLCSFGFQKGQQTMAIGMLSDGQKSRLLFAMLAMKASGVLLLDEPTNHLDIDAVDGLADAIKNFGGGVVLVSHDFRLIDQVANEIWVCENRTVRRFDGTIHQYKALLAKKMAKHKV